MKRYFLKRKSNGIKKLQWCDLDDLTNKISEARDNKNKSLSVKRKSMPRSTAQGLDTLTRIVGEEFFLQESNTLA